MCVFVRGKVFFDLFNTLLFSSYDPRDIGVGRNQLLEKFVFGISMLVVPIVLLNLLIAVMGASYERINARAQMELLFLRAKAIRQQEISFRLEESHSGKQ